MSQPMTGDNVRQITAQAALQRRQAVLALYRRLGSYEKVGEAMGISKQRVGMLIKRALGDLGATETGDQANGGP